MSDTDSLPQKIYLNPAELVIAEEPSLVTTVLGSCISVTLFSPRLRVGAICHAVLPQAAGSAPSKYVDQSVRYMLKYFQQRDIAPDELVAKLFGGADMFTPRDPEGQNRSVGAQNIRMALDSLLTADLKPAAMDIGGQQGRKLIFHSHTGEVFLQRVAKQAWRSYTEQSATEPPRKR